jgi:hypothetical protein
MTGGGVLGNGGLGDLLPSDLPDGFEDFGGPGAGGPVMHEVMRPVPARPMGQIRMPRRGMGDAAAMPEPIMVQAPPPKVAAPAILAGVTASLVTVGLLAGLYAVARRLEWV